ncbi:methyltransferase domain-containing protein [Prochlorococcus marinus]|uniref:methyltransferase domain-containing protein n=1 Tax=Prochlorococcus marinus TaxID=1219 RepID=UPI0007B3F864|nr:methyltransferase domain-containing protein [Prochlorococcus marinus]KZR78153.1 Trans-aconitate 2-methyltransferase [Prochlorococcus marinus str. MIT 1320]
MNERPEYYQRANPDLLARIPLTAESVLEVGCGAGALGAAFKARQPDVKYWGIEYEQEPANQARQALDHVICGDVEDPALPLPQLGSVNCIVYGDVLEHLRDPWSVVKRHRTLLADDGVFLACIPNVQHWSVLEQLLHGNWPLLEEGIFDKTHLRWFTRSSIASMITNAGFCLDEIHPRIFDLDQAKSFARRLKPVLVNLDLNPSTFLQDIAPLQYIVRASIKPRTSLHLHILLTIRNFPALADVRLLKPTYALQSLPRISSRIGHEINLRQPDESNPCIVIWHRPRLRRISEDYKKLRKLITCGYVIITEMDDDPAHGLEAADSEDLPYLGVHAVQVSTSVLAGEIKRWNPEVKVFANNLVALPASKSLINSGDRLKIFFGALNREDDWTPWMPALNEIFADQPQRWEVDVVHDEKFYQELNLPASCKTFTPTCDYKTYREVLGGCDIAFLPLLDTRFNRFKSDLKAVEAAAHGLAILASPTVYSSTLVDGETAAFFWTREDLKRKLLAWSEDPKGVRAMGARAREWVRSERLLCHQVCDREAWYRDLWNRREELTLMLKQREPEIFTH